MMDLHGKDNPFVDKVKAITAVITLESILASPLDPGHFVTGIVGMLIPHTYLMIEELRGKEAAKEWLAKTMTFISDHFLSHGNEVSTSIVEKDAPSHTSKEVTH